MIIQGKALLLKDNINTDDIIAGQYLRANDPSIWKQHIFENIDPKLSTIIQHKNFIIAGENFGCGSSREQAVIAIKLCGIKAIIAKSFGRIFYRNCLNNGIIAANFSQAQKLNIDMSHKVTLDILRSKLILNEEIIMLNRIDPIAIEIYKTGGLLTYFKQHGELRI